MKELLAEYKAIKEGTKKVKMCKFADGCKYKYKCRFTHPSDLRKEEEEKQAHNPEQLGKEFGKDDDKLTVDKADIQDSVEVGMKRARAAAASAAAASPFTVVWVSFSVTATCCSSALKPSCRGIDVLQHCSWFVLWDEGRRA